MSRPIPLRFRFRFQEWLADRVSWVQYPNLSGPRVTFWRNQMPLSTRAFLVLVGITALAVCVMLASALGLLAWAAISA
jgi:hypothetical protein